MCFSLNQNRNHIKNIICNQILVGFVETLKYTTAAKRTVRLVCGRDDWLRAVYSTESTECRLNAKLHKTSDHSHSMYSQTALELCLSSADRQLISKLSNINSFVALNLPSNRCSIKL